MKRRDALKLVVGAAVAPLVPVVAADAAKSAPEWFEEKSCLLQEFEYHFGSKFARVRVDGMDFMVKAVGPDAVIDCTTIVHLNGAEEFSPTIHMERLIRATERERLRREVAGIATDETNGLDQHSFRIDA